MRHVVFSCSTSGFPYGIARVLIVPKTGELCVSQMIGSRLPQMPSIYLLMFVLGSMTRYSRAILTISSNRIRPIL
jgi:hypothetical protein